MQKIITTVVALTFALGLAGAASAQVVKTPDKPAVQATQAQVAPKEAPKPGEPAAKEAAKPGDKTKEAVKPGEKQTSPQAAKKEAKQSKTEKKHGAHMETPPAGVK